MCMNRWGRGLSMEGRGQEVSLGCKRCRVECESGVYTTAGTFWSPWLC